MVVGGSEYLGLCDFPGVAHDSSSFDRFDDVLASYLYGPRVFWSCIIWFLPSFFFGNFFRNICPVSEIGIKSSYALLNYHGLW